LEIEAADAGGRCRRPRRHRDDRVAWLREDPSPSFGADPERHRSPTGEVAPAEQRPGDPVAGYHALVNEAYVTCGMPYEAWRRLAPETDPANLLPGREGRNAELPYFLTAHVNADGVEVVSNNCLVCHASRLGDEVVVGMGDHVRRLHPGPAHAGQPGRPLCARPGADRRLAALG
jgi:hypothetical protein